MRCASVRPICQGQLIGLANWLPATKKQFPHALGQVRPFELTYPPFRGAVREDPVPGEYPTSAYPTNQQLSLSTRRISRLPVDVRVSLVVK